MKDKEEVCRERKEKEVTLKKMSPEQKRREKRKREEKKKRKDVISKII